MDYQFLHLLNFSDLKNWSVQFLLGIQSSYNDNYPLVPLGNFLIRNKKPVEIQDDKEYKRVTIKINNSGVFLRDIEIGKNIGTKNQFEIKESQFILSKIDARNGAFGIANSNVDGAIITGNFWAYDVNYSKIDPIYLSLITTTNYFIKFCQKSSVGTTNRNYLQEELFLAEQIPLPDIDIQKSLVSAYQEKIRQAETLEKQAEQIDIEIEQYLFENLGIEVNQNQRKKQGVLQFVKFKDIDRWDILFNLGQLPTISANCELLKIRDLIYPINSTINGESLRFESYKNPSQEFYYIGMENVEKNTGCINVLQKVKGVEIKSQTIKVPKNYFIYGKLRPYLNKFWYNNTDLEDVICSSEFLVFALKNTIKKDYFLSVIGQSFVQKQITDKVSGARMPRLSPDDFLDIDFPLPPIEIQNQIASHIQALKTQQKQAKTQAQILREQAIAEFEQAIFI